MAIDEIKMNEPTHLSQDQLTALKAELLRERRQFVAPIEDPSEEADLADDPGTRLAERQVFEEMSARHTALLEGIDHALERITQGVYGTCEDCGVEIPFERLDAIPDAVLCIDCQAKVG